MRTRILTLSFVVLGLSTLPSCASGTGGAPPSKAAGPGGCTDGKVPTGQNGACMSTCAEDSDCPKGSPCLPTQFDMGGGEIAHVKVCG
jgi:hypothetical protein